MAHVRPGRRDDPRRVRGRTRAPPPRGREANRRARCRRRDRPRRRTPHRDPDGKGRPAGSRLRPRRERHRRRLHDEAPRDRRALGHDGSCGRPDDSWRLPSPPGRRRRSGRWDRLDPRPHARHTQRHLASRRLKLRAAGRAEPPAGSKGMAGFLLGAAGMFAVTYSTQAILPELGRSFGVSPAQAGLTISVVVLALACGAWIWGPLSDQYGRKRSIVLACALLVPPTIGAALAPNFGLLLAFRALQGLCMPGLLTAGVPYITEVFTPRIGGRAMGNYVTALIAGGLVGRVGVALLSAGLGWRWAIGLLAVLPLAAALVMRRSLIDLPIAPAEGGRLSGVRRQLRNGRL